MYKHIIYFDIHLNYFSYHGVTQISAFTQDNLNSHAVKLMVFAFALGAFSLGLSHWEGVTNAGTVMIIWDKINSTI